jgi:hypothetical protein
MIVYKYDRYIDIEHMERSFQFCLHQVAPMEFFGTAELGL